MEKLYAKMQHNGSSGGTAHHVHRTIRNALNEAVRRGHLARNPALLAKAPKLTDEETEPYTVGEVQRLLKVVAERRNGPRWVVALALGLRQGEALGLKWEYVDLTWPAANPPQPATPQVRARVRRHVRPEGRILPRPETGPRRRRPD